MPDELKPSLDGDTAYAKLKAWTRPCRHPLAGGIAAVVGCLFWPLAMLAGSQRGSPQPISLVGYGPVVLRTWLWLSTLAGPGANVAMVAIAAAWWPRWEPVTGSVALGICGSAHARVASV